MCWIRRRRPLASPFAAISADGSLHISSKRRLWDTMLPSTSTTRIPSAVDSRVAWRTETVRESAPLRGLFALFFDLAVFAAVTRGVAMDPEFMDSRVSGQKVLQPILLAEDRRA